AGFVCSGQVRRCAAYVCPVQQQKYGSKGNGLHRGGAEFVTVNVCSPRSSLLPRESTPLTPTSYRPGAKTPAGIVTESSFARGGVARPCQTTTPPSRRSTTSYAG